MMLLTLSPLLEEGWMTKFSLVGAGLLFVGGVIIVIQTLRHSLFKSKLALEEEERKRMARAEYWRTMESAVSRLTDLVQEIDSQIDDRTETIEKLSAEAETAITALSQTLDAVEGLASRAHENRAAAAAAQGKKASGKVVDMKAAGAALVRRTHRQVYEAFDMGQDIQQISRESGLGIGEIELILALRERIERQGS